MCTLKFLIFMGYCIWSYVSDGKKQIMTSCGHVFCLLIVGSLGTTQFYFLPSAYKWLIAYNWSFVSASLNVHIWQENYVNYRPSSVGKDDSGIKRMSSLARVAESIADGDIINVQIRRYRQWQLSQSSCVSSCIIPYEFWYCYISLLVEHKNVPCTGPLNFLFSNLYSALVFLSSFD